VLDVFAIFFYNKVFKINSKEQQMISDLTIEDLTIEHQEHEHPIVRFSTYQKFGFTRKAFNDKSYLVRHAAYRELGFEKNAIKSE